MRARHRLLWAGWRLWHLSTTVASLGVALTVFYRDTYNNRGAFIAPIPLLAVRFDHVTVNFTHFSKISDFHSVNTTAMLLSIPIR